MKSLKLISLAQTMLFCNVINAQEKTLNQVEAKPKAILKNSFHGCGLAFLSLVNNPAKSTTQNEIKSDSLIVGKTSCMNNNEKILYIVDGVPTKERIHIDPEDIESVSVLKDQVPLISCSSWNRVLVIKTKSGSKLPMDGTYKIEFNYNIKQSDGYITFDNYAYTMNDNRFKQHYGTINYDKNLISFSSEYDSDTIIEFRSSEIGKESINFQVRTKRSGITNYLDFPVNRGRLIKVN